MTGDARLEQAAAVYAGEKGNLRFPLDRPIPYDLIEEIVKFRAHRNRAHRNRAHRNRAKGSRTKGRVSQR